MKTWISNHPPSAWYLLPLGTVALFFLVLVYPNIVGLLLVALVAVLIYVALMVWSYWSWYWNQFIFEPYDDEGDGCDGE